jgi:hypothetical protein
VSFLDKWAEASYTTLGFFWMALWAFALGYTISSMIQVFVTRERMQRAMGRAGLRSVALGTFFGFVSSSCSFAALAATKSLFKKGAGLIPALAFLLASTNLVIELGIVIAVFLSWHFVMGEYVGGLLLIAVMWVFVKLTKPEGLVRQVREKLQDEGNESEGREVPDWREMIRTRKGWGMVGRRYIMEWQMVWKDVTVGFTVAGIIAAFVPREFFGWLFIGTGGRGSEGASLSFLQVLEHTLVGPLAAFMTFIGSMGNIPLAGILYRNGVSVAGIMAFIFSDLVVFPVLRINAKYYNWRMSLYILVTLLISLVVVALLIHYGFYLLGLEPQAEAGQMKQEFFELNYTTFLNVAFLGFTGLLIWLRFQLPKDHGGHMMAEKGWVEILLFWLSITAYAWLAGGIVVRLFVRS